MKIGTAHFSRPPFAGHSTMVTFILIVVVIGLAIGFAALAFQASGKRKGQKEQPAHKQKPPAPPPSRAPGVD
jgi:hypothetical protein